MKVVAWNSAGAKWGRFWKYYVTPQPGDTVVGLLVEAGWAPWIKSVHVPVDTVIPLDSAATRYVHPDPGIPPDPNVQMDAKMVDDITKSRRLKAFWIPWAATPGGYITNSRCSIGAVLAPAREQLQGVMRIRVPWFKRPVLRIQLGPGRNTTLTILLVHMISGAWKQAADELDYLTSSMQSLIPEGTAGLIVGDMNVDLLKNSWTPAQDWTLIRSGAATQSGGGELDYAVLWDPAGTWQHSWKVLDTYGQGNNTSDHTVMEYVLTGP